MKKYLYHILVILLIILSGCNFLDKKICGELNFEEKCFLDSINKQYGQYLYLSDVPCYFTFIDIHLKDSLNDTIINAIHMKILENTNLQWDIVSVYDKHNIFLFQQVFNDGKFMRSEMCSK